MANKIDKHQNISNKPVDDYFDEYGRELPDPIPAALPIGFKRQPTLQETIKRLVRSEISREADENGQETFDEADDFEVDDDPLPNTPYEQDFDQEIAPPPSKVKQPFEQEIPANEVDPTHPTPSGPVPQPAASQTAQGGELRLPGLYPN